MNWKSRLCVWLAALACALVWVAVLAGPSRARGEACFETALLQLDALRGRVEELEAAAAKTAGVAFDALVKEAETERQLQEARALAGLTRVAGGGIRVQMNPRASTTPAGMDADLLRLVNELRASGAEAITVNGERLGARSGIRSVESKIVIHNQYFSAPFTIDAIGNAEALENALCLPQGVRDILEQRYTMRLVRVDDLSMEPYGGPAGFEFAAEEEPHG